MPAQTGAFCCSAGEVRWMWLTTMEMNSETVGGESRGYPAISMRSARLTRQTRCTKVRKLRSTADHEQSRRLATSE